MIKRFCLAVLIVAVLWLPVLGADELAVLTPNASAYSASELAALKSAITNIQDLLNDYGLGSGRYFASTEWLSSDFAAYTAGILASNGYETHLVAQEGWPDGEHAWVLVGIVLPTRTALIPVEASPSMRSLSRFLVRYQSMLTMRGRRGSRRNTQCLLERSFCPATFRPWRQSV